MSSDFLNLRFTERWMLEGLCSLAGGDRHWDDWFAPENTFTARDATAVCWECPIREACLRHACEAEEPYGIRGGIPASVRKDYNHDIQRLLVEPNPYVRDRRKTNRSKFAEAGLKKYTRPEDQDDE